MTPDHARAQADQLDAEAIEAAKAGDIERGVLLSLQANRLREMARLQEAERSDNVRPVNNLEAQKARRGRAVARAKADSPLKIAVTHDPLKRWGSMSIYAKRLGVSKASLSEYESGVTPCPARIDRMVRKDFPSLKWQWPRGVVD